MFLNFVANLYKNLILQDFELSKVLPNDLSISEKTKYLCMEKRIGNSFCFALAINVDAIEENKLIEFTKGFTAHLESNYSVFHSKNIHVVYILIFNKQQNIVKQLVENGEAFENQEIFNIFWGINPEKGDFIVNENQPTEIGGIKNTLNKSLNKSLDSELLSKENIELSNLAQEAISNSPFGAVDRDVYFAFLAIAINALIFGIMNLGESGELLFSKGALIPKLILEQHQYYRLITATFLHANILHLASNCLGIYIFGTRVEKYYGKAKFIIIYFASCTFGSILSLLLTNSVSVGASGAVYGLIGATVSRTFISKRAMDGLSFYLMLLYIAVGFTFGLLNSNIDNFGHLGGLLGGLLIGFLFSSKSE